MIRVKLRDAIEGLLALDEASVGLVLSDLPSGQTRAEFDRPPELLRLWPAIWRCLRPGGCAVLMASTLPFAAELIRSQPRAYRYDIVWRKNRATGHLNANRQPLRAHEFALVFSEGAARYYPQMTPGAPTSGGSRVTVGENYDQRHSRPTVRRQGSSRYPVSVVDFDVVSGRRKHPQQKPEPLLRWIVRTYSAPGELVVDPYAGSGSTAVAAEAEGRLALCWDSSSRFAADELERVQKGGG